MAARRQRPYRCKQAVTFKEEDDDSDTEAEEFNLEPRKSDGRELQIIHSGHFMVSSLHMEHTPKKGYDFDTVNKQTCRTYPFGKTSRSLLSIDASLTKLFECMTLAYSGKLLSPKWKNFKGLKLLWRDKIRLNNAIWRAWYMQYVERRRNPICHFVTPLDRSIETEDQRRPEAIATEVKCWKRGVDIAREYHKWRTYFKKRVQKHRDEDLSGLLKGTDEPYSLSLFGDVPPDALRSELRPDSPVLMELDPLFDMEMWISESSDTLFSTLASHQPAGWPNPREIGHNGNADMIQPGLGNLQPNLDFTFDPLDFSQDLFHSLRQAGPFPVPPTPSSIPQTQTSLLPSVTTSPKIPSVGATNRVADMCSAAFCPEGYPPLYPAPQTLAPVPESAAAVPLPTPPPNSAPHPSAVQSSNMATWNPALGDPLPTYTAAVSSAPPRLTPKPALPTPPPTLVPPGAQTSSLPAGTAARPAFKPPKPRPPPDLGQRPRRVQNIVPAQPRPPPPLFVTGPFPAHPSAVLIAPSPLKAEASPPSNVIIAPGDITPQYCRQSHISSEQKRRFSINLGFRTLCSLVSTLKTKSSSRPVTNAATLQKTVEYIGKLQHERHQIQEEVRGLREEIEELNASISSCHQKLPATGVSVTRHRQDLMWDRFNEYVQSRTLHNWMFWIFSIIIIKPLFESFNSMVSTASVLELHRTTLQWLEQRCSLPALRPMVRDTLLQLSTSTSILTDPTRLPDEAYQAVGRTAGKTGES